MLHEHLAAMAASEATMEQRARALLDEIAHPGVRALVERAQGSGVARRRALVARLNAIAPDVAIPPAPAATPVLPSLTADPARRASMAVVELHALLAQAVLGYAILLQLSFRAADSVEHLGPENTGDLAWEHLRACAVEVRDLLRAMPYVVADELEEQGRDCRCNCPTCGLGVCGCVLAFRRRLDLAAAEAGPVEDWPGLRLVRPREGSPAARAGLAKGEVLETIDGAVLDSIPNLQAAISGHASGEEVEFGVRRDGATVPVQVARP